MVAPIRDAARIGPARRRNVALLLTRARSETPCLLDDPAARCPHPPPSLEVFDAGDVRFRPRALRFARREVERGALVVDRARLAVDPAEAERLLDRGVVVDARLPGRLLPGHEPDCRRRLVVALEPVTPVGAVLELHDLGVVAHTDWLPSAAATPPRSSPLSGRVELRNCTSRRSHVKRKETPATTDATTKTGWSADATPCI